MTPNLQGSEAVVVRLPMQIRVPHPLPHNNNSYGQTVRLGSA